MKLEFNPITGQLDLVQEPTEYDSFLELIDTPTSYTEKAGNIVRVKGSADQLEFATIDTIADTTYLRLDTTNDPLTGPLDIKTSDANALRVMDSSSNIFLDIDTTNTSIPKMAIGMATEDTPTFSVLTLKTVNDAAGGLYMVNDPGNDANQNGRFSIASYLAAEEPTSIFFGTTIVANNLIRFGGGATTENASTSCSFWTAPAVNTLLGTLLMNLTTFLDINTYVDQDYTVEDAVASITNNTDWRLTVTTTGNNSKAYRAGKYTTIYTSNDSLTNTMALQGTYHDTQITGGGTVTGARSLGGQVTVSSGTLTNGVGLYLGHTNSDTFTNYYGIELEAVGTSATNLYTLKIDDAGFVNAANNSLLVDNVGTDFYIPLINTGLTIGIGTAGVDYTLTFNGETNDGLLTWMEDEDYFKFGDNVNIDTLTASKFVKTNASKTLVSADIMASDITRTFATPNTLTVTTGTLTSGTVSDAQAWADGNEIHITEVTGTPGFDVRFTFNSITDFTEIMCSFYYVGSATHSCVIQIYDDTNAVWRDFFSQSGAPLSHNTRFSPFPDPTNVSNYINGSDQVIVRFYHPQSGNASHDLYIDYISLIH